MSISTTPAPARTDAPTLPSAAVATSDSFVRRAGTVLAAGAFTWAASTAVVGNDPTGITATRVQDLGGLAFQVGVVALLMAFLRTGALGRRTRAFVRVELVLLTLAMTWTVLHAADPVWADDTTWVVALDAFWPLSMLGMAVLGVKVLRARVWSGSLRWAPLIAETWALVTIPAFVVGELVGQPWIARVVGVTHLLIGYTRLGVLLARRPELTR